MNNFYAVDIDSSSVDQDLLTEYAESLKYQSSCSLVFRGDVGNSFEKTPLLLACVWLSLKDKSLNRR